MPASTKLKQAALGFAAGATELFQSDSGDLRDGLTGCTAWL